MRKCLYTYALRFTKRDSSTTETSYVARFSQEITAKGGKACPSRIYHNITLVTAIVTSRILLCLSGGNS